MIRTAVALALTTLAPGCAGLSMSDGSALGGPRRPIALLPIALETPGLPDPATPAGWRRPPGPPRVALQAGHWRSEDAPAEQGHLRVNGTRGGGWVEWRVNLGIARKTAEILREEGYFVDLLPTTVPPGYRADLFIAIHADGHANPSVSGYRAAAPRRDATGRAEAFAALLERSYGEATGLPLYPLVTRRMRGYYAFNDRAYEHALHPLTVGVILETGFLSSPRDRRVIVNAPERAARGIATAVIRFLEPMPVEPRPMPQAD